MMGRHSWRRLAAAVGLVAGLAMAGAAPAQEGMPDRDAINAVTAPESGVTAWHVRDSSVPLVAIELSFPGGALLDPSGRAGTAELVSRVLNEGAGDYSADAFARALDRLGARFSISAGREAMRIRIKAMPGDLGEIMELARLALTEARLSEAAIERAREAQASAIAQRNRRPGYQASRRLVTGLFGDHAYARPRLGTQESVAAITRADLEAFIDAQFTRDRVEVAAAGAIDAESLAEHLDKLLAPLPATSEAPVAAPEVTPAFDGDVTVIERDLPQTLIYAAVPDVVRTEPDWYAAQLLREILGSSSLVGRLGQAIRGERGLAYSVSASGLSWEQAAVTLMAARVDHGDAGEAHRLMDEVWQGLADGVSDRELTRARRQLVDGFPLRLTSTDGLASTLLAVKRQPHLDRGYLARRGERFAAVTPADIADLAARLQARGALTTVATGQPAGLGE